LEKEFKGVLMGKVSQQAKKNYSEYTKKYKIIIEEIIIREKALDYDVKTGKVLEDVERKKIDMTNSVLNMASYYILLNTLSVNLLGIKNENFLNEARKACYRAIIYLEGIVSDFIDVPLSELSENQKSISGYDDEKRYELVKKLGFTIDSVEKSYGENTRWRWSFVELEGRYATVSKNLIDFRSLVKGMDPTVEGYEIRMYHLNLVKELLHTSSTRYREKYELTTFRIDDFKLAINYLSALRRIHLYLGETSEAETTKKNIDIWKAKMEKDSVKSI
jgi:hypothetical protein